MKAATIVALLALGFSASYAAADDLAEKEMKDNPGVSAPGPTADPTAKPSTSGLAEKAMKDSPGVTGGGTTATPTAKPETGGLAEKAMQDHPGIDKK
jgi:hypothetical protein